MATHEGSADLLILLAALALHLADRRKLLSSRLLHGYPRLAVTVVAKASRAVCVAALVPRLKGFVIWFFTSVDVTNAFAVLPSALFMSRASAGLDPPTSGWRAALRLPFRCLSPLTQRRCIDTRVVP